MKKVKIVFPILLLCAFIGISFGIVEIQSKSFENKDKILNKDIKSNNLNGSVKYVDEYFINLETNEKMDSFIKEFNEKGILIKKINDFIRATDFVEISCDSRGFPISGKREVESKNGEKQIYSLIFKCNSHGLITEKETKIDLFESKTHILYNKDGFETSRRNFTFDLLTSIDSTEYDEQNKIVRFAHLDANTLIATYEVFTTYSDNGREIIEIWYTNQKPNRINKKIEDLDEFNNPITRIIINDGDTLSTWKFNYTYDDENNWVERIGYKEGIIGSKWKRDIKYY